MLCLPPPQQGSLTLFVTTSVRCFCSCALWTEPAASPVTPARPTATSWKGGVCSVRPLNPLPVLCSVRDKIWPFYQLQQVLLNNPFTLQTWRRRFSILNYWCVHKHILQLIPLNKYTLMWVNIIFSTDATIWIFLSWNLLSSLHWLREIVVELKS